MDLKRSVSSFSGGDSDSDSIFSDDDSDDEGSLPSPEAPRRKKSVVYNVLEKDSKESLSSCVVESGVMPTGVAAVPADLSISGQSVDEDDLFKKVFEFFPNKTDTKDDEGIRQEKNDHQSVCEDYSFKGSENLAENKMDVITKVYAKDKTINAGEFLGLTQHSTYSYILQTPVRVYPSNRLEVTVDDVNEEKVELMESSGLNKSEEDVISTLGEEDVLASDNVENSLLNNVALEKIKALTDYYRLKIETTKNGAGGNQINAKLIKWQDILDCMESKDLSRVESLENTWLSKVNQKKYDHVIIKNTKKQKIFSVIYRVAKIVIAIACIGLFFSGVGAPVAFAIYAGFGTLTLLFGIFKYYWQNRTEKKLNALEKKLNHLNYQPIRV